MTSGPSDRLQALENTKGLTGAWKNRRDMREIMPRFIAFAGITALQLDGWYRNNRYCGHCGGYVLSCTSFSYVLLRLSIVLHDGLAAPIVRGEVHKVFGPDVTLAPAKKLADGSTAVPWSKLSPEEQSKINAQLVQEQLKAATLLTANLGKEVAKEPERRRSVEHPNSADAHRRRQRQRRTAAGTPRKTCGRAGCER